MLSDERKQTEPTLRASLAGRKYADCGWMVGVDRRKGEWWKPPWPLENPCFPELARKLPRGGSLKGC